MSTMNRILILLGITTVIFMAVCFYFIWHGRLLPDSLIYSYFSAIGAEGFIMGWIKNGKLKMESGKYEKGDNENENYN